MLRLLSVGLYACTLPISAPSVGGGDLPAPSGATGGTLMQISEPSSMQPAGPSGATNDSALACPTHASFCESFEEGLDTTRWPNWTSLASGWSLAEGGVTGKRALRLRSGPSVGLPDGMGGSITTRAIPAPEDRMYMRVFMKIADLGLPDWHPAFFQGVPVDWTGDWQHQSSLYFGSLRNDLCITALGEQTDFSVVWYENKAYAQEGDDDQDAEQTVKANEWFCLEMLLYGDDQGDTDHSKEHVQTWIDDVEIATLGMSDSDAKNGGSPSEHWMLALDESRWIFSANGLQNREYEMWYDGIAFSTQRIGCGKAVK